MNTWIFGMSGMGKSTMLVRDALSDIEQDRGVLFVDPSGGAADALLARFPKRRVRDAVIIDPTDTERPVGFNVLDGVENPPLMASLIVSTVKAIWNYADVATPVMDRMLYNTIAVLIETGGTLLDIEPMLANPEFRRKRVERVTDPYLAEKWRRWSEVPQKDWRQLIQSTENKAGEFAEDPRIRNIVGQARSAFDVKRVMNGRGVIVLRLPVGELGQKARMFGSLFLAAVQAVAYSRTVHLPYSIYIDDCHHFDTPVLRDLLANGPRYGLSVTVANQYLGQLSRDLRSSLIGSSERRIMFRCGIEDSEYLHRTIPRDETKPLLHELGTYEAMWFDRANLSRVQTYRPEPLQTGKRKRRLAVVAQSRRRYGSRKRRG